MRGGQVRLNRYDQTMSFLRYSSLARLMSALVSTFLVANTFLFSAPLLFLILRLSSFSDFLLGFLLGRMASLLSRQVGSYLRRYCWLSQLRQKPEERLPPKAVLKPKSTMFLGSQWNLLAISSRSSFCETLGLPSWQTSSNSSRRAKSLLMRRRRVFMVMVIKQYINQKIIFNLEALPLQIDPQQLAVVHHCPTLSRTELQTIALLSHLFRSRSVGSEFLGLCCLSSCQYDNVGCFDNIKMQHTFQLMRHAYARHNRQKDDWKQRFGGKGYKKLPQFVAAKLSECLIDDPWVDERQCGQVKEGLDFTSIGLVLCSPLQRCLNTCQALLPKEGAPQVVVEPLLASRLNAAWAIGSGLDELRGRFEGLNFEGMEDWREKLWGGGSLCQQKQKEGSEAVCQKGVEGREDDVQNWLLGKLKLGEVESYAAFFQRSRSLRKRIAELVRRYGDGDRKEVLIISHSCVLSFLLGSELTEGGKVKDKISFEHCLPRRFSAEQVLGASQLGVE